MSSTVWNHKGFQDTQELAERWGKEDGLLGDGWSLHDVVTASTIAGLFKDEAAVIAYFESKGPEWFNEEIMMPFTCGLLDRVEAETGLANCID